MSGEPLSITGISSMATRQILAELADAYAVRSGLRVSIESIGGVAAVKRIQEGEAFDIVVLASNAIDQLMSENRVDDSSRVNIARSGVAVAVATGAQRPSIETEADVREAVLSARSIGYSTGPSGAYLMDLFQRWGIAEAIAVRIIQAPPGVAVGSLIARGEVALGFQQMSEFLEVDGIDILGPLPPSIQTMTVFQGAVCSNARVPQDARALLAFMTSADVDEVKRKNGMQPPDGP
ncbi:ABC transporter substrate-binding protein [Paraburkholderia dipogonis]|uniref:ABC transporter substrate-binding protein n=1 Tax=Paraburkholderia dipogonis TaxID=1211383 RepID=A0A4Y8MG86_9BURK|nr:substrate-binding domain-containing protein [Paraburkholderia dipogonis]TFE36448.1 ABC transporter substrate-binding protein [Paraburkholderia dipogonis]